MCAGCVAHVGHGEQQLRDDLDNLQVLVNTTRHRLLLDDSQDTGLNEVWEEYLATGKVIEIDSKRDYYDMGRVLSPEKHFLVHADPDDHRVRTFMSQHAGPPRAFWTVVVSQLTLAQYSIS